MYNHEYDKLRYSIMMNEENKKKKNMKFKIIYNWCQFWPPNLIVLWWKYKGYYYQRIFGIDFRVVYKKGKYHPSKVPSIINAGVYK